MNGPCFQYLEQYFLTVPLCTKHKFCYSNIIMMIPLKITTNLSEIVKKNVWKCYLQQPLSIQEDLWGLSSQLPTKPCKIIMQLKLKFYKNRTLSMKEDTVILCFTRNKKIQTASFGVHKWIISPRRRWRKSPAKAF